MNLFDMVDYIFFALIALMGLVIGYLAYPRPPEPLRPICSCSHGYGKHHEGAVCQGEVERRHYNSYGDHSGHEWVHCACSRYDGPDPAIFGLERFR